MLEDALYRDPEEDSFGFSLALDKFGIKDLITRRKVYCFYRLQDIWILSSTYTLFLFQIRHFIDLMEI